MIMERAWRFSDVGIFLIRFGAGLMLATLHGWGKVAAAYGNLARGQEWPFVGAVASLGLAAGLFTRYAAFFVLVNMTVAVYRHLTSDLRYELAALYGLIALGFVFVRPGNLSLDAWLGRRSRRR
jgi:uncharacterized membrane protein YphA (DoxX/SURF4 family)